MARGSIITMCILISIIGVLVDGSSCEKRYISSGDEAEITCILPQSCTAGLWTKIKAPGSSKNLTSEDCNFCGQKFAVIDSYDDTIGKNVTSLKFLQPDVSVDSNYTCYCKPSFESSRGPMLECYAISVFSHCHLNISINGKEKIINSTTLSEKKYETINVTTEDELLIECPPDDGRNVDRDCPTLENNGSFKVDRSLHRCSIACVRRNHGHKCKAKLVLNVDVSKEDNKTFSDLRRKVVIINFVILSVFFASFLCGSYLFHKRTASKVSVTNQTNRQYNAEMYCPMDSPLSTLRTGSCQVVESNFATRGHQPGSIAEITYTEINTYQEVDHDSHSTNEESFTTHLNPLKVIKIETKAEMGPYLVNDCLFQKGENPCPEGQCIDGGHFAQTIEFHSIQSKGPPQPYITMGRSSLECETSELDGIDLYIIKE